MSAKLRCRFLMSPFLVRATIMQAPNHLKMRCRLSALAVVLASCGLLVGAASATPQAVAMVQVVNGTLRVRRSGARSFKIIAPRQKLYAGDVVRTGPQSRAVLRMSNGNQLQLSARTTLEVLPPVTLDEATARLFGLEPKS